MGSEVETTTLGQCSSTNIFFSNYFTQFLPTFLQFAFEHHRSIAIRGCSLSLKKMYIFCFLTSTIQLTIHLQKLDVSINVPLLHYTSQQKFFFYTHYVPLLSVRSVNEKKNCFIVEFK